MNRLTKIGITLFILLGVSTPSFPLVNMKEDPNGFRGKTWDMNIKEFDGLDYKLTDKSYGGIKKFTKKGDDLQIGGATVDIILYGFWKDSFSSVTIMANDYVNCSNLHQALTAKFGDGYQSNKYIERYAWFGDYTTILYQYNEIAKKCTAFLSSVSISKRQKEYNEKRASDGAVKGF